MATQVPLDPAVFEDNLDRVLAVLCNARNAGNDRLTALEIASVLRDDHRLRMHWRSVNALLLEVPHLADRKKKSGRWCFAILKAGVDRVSLPPTSISFVDPAKAVQAVVTLHELLGSCQGIVRVCDPYLDDITMQHLDACIHATELRMLTRNVRDSGVTRSIHAAFRTQGRPLQVKIVGANVLHDRYIIDDKRMLILGTSLNGFGKKQCFVIEAGSDMRRSLLPVFDGHWATGTLWP